MSGRLEGKVALISGGARGLGATEARLFVEQGAKVVLGDLLDEQGLRIADELNRGADSQRALYAHLDVTKATDWEDAVSTAEREFGRLDVNQKGVWRGMKAAVGAMRRAGGGSIVNTSSLYALIGSGAAAAYQASKGAVRILSKTAAVQYAPENIRVNSVYPGIATTPMVEQGIPEEGRQGIASLSLLKREAKPEEIAYGVLFLASDEASYVVGAELVIDGGYSAA